MNTLKNYNFARRCSAAVLGCSIAVMLGFHTACAANQTWDGGSATDELWSTAANWLGDPIPPGAVGATSADVAIFNAAIANTWGDSALNPIGIDLDRNIGGISFTGNSGNYFIGATGGNALKVGNGGTIQILQALTATNAVATINAPLQIQGTDGLYTLRNNSASGTGAGAGTLRIGGNITATAGRTGLVLTGSNTNANTIDGIISNGTASEFYFHKTGTGNWTLTAANTYTGTTNIEGGTLTLAFGSIAANILPSTTSLTLQGGTLALTSTGTQTVNGLLTTADTASRVVLGANETLTLGALVSAGAGSALNFNLATGGANGATVGTGVVVLTGQTPGNAISPSFTVSDAGGFGLATVNGANQVVRLTTTALLPVSGALSGTDYRIDNNASGAAAAGSAALAITASQTARSITVDTTTAAGVLTLNPGVVLSSDTWNVGGVGSNGWRITGGTSGAGLQAATPGGNLYLNNFNAAPLRIDSPILDNANSGVRLRGTGSVIFSAANTYAGTTIVHGGSLEVAAGGAINSPNAGSNIFVGYNPGDNAAFALTGGTVLSSSTYIGNNAGTVGMATMSGGTWSALGNFDVGGAGTGVLTMTSGQINSSNSNIGTTTGANGTVTISGGSWTNTGTLDVGNSGTGVLNITGGTHAFQAIRIGDGPGGNGTMNVSGARVTGQSIYLTSNSGSRGVLNVTDNAVVDLGSSGGVRLATSVGSPGTLNIGTGGVAGNVIAAVVTSPQIGNFVPGILNFNHTGTVSFTPQLVGFINTNKLGPGTTILKTVNNSRGAISVSQGQLLFTAASSSTTGLGVGGITVGTGATFGYTPSSEGVLKLFGPMTVKSGGAITGSIGATTFSSGMSIQPATGNRFLAEGPYVLNLSGISGVSRAAGTNNYVLIGFPLFFSPGSPTLGLVYNNTDFTVGGVSKTTTTVAASITSATPISDAYWVGGFSAAPNVWSASNGSTTSNWATTSGGPVQVLVPGPAANVTISAAAPVTPSAPTTLGANMSFAGLTIADTTNGVRLDADGFNLTLGSGGLTMNAGVPTSTFAADLVLGASQTWLNQSANALTISGTISGAGAAALTKSGTGTILLSGTNTYTGPTNLNQGSLLVSGSISGSTTTGTGTGSLLGGTGVVGGVTVNSGAILQGGDGTAATSALSSGGDVSLLDGSILKLVLGHSGAHSSLSRTGGSWSFDTDQMFSFTNLGATESLYDNVISGLTGTEPGLATIGTWQIDPASGVAGNFSYDGAGGVDLVVIPEPGSAALLLASIPFLSLGRSRRRQSRTAPIA